MKKTLILVSLMIAGTANAQDYNAAGKTTFQSCADSTFVIKEGMGGGEAFLRLLTFPITGIACSLAGTAEVAYNWSSDTEENSLRWKKDKTEEEVARMEELRGERGERGMYGYGGWGGQSSASSKTVYLPSGAYQVSRSGNDVFVNQVSKTK